MSVELKDLDLNHVYIPSRTEREEAARRDRQEAKAYVARVEVARQHAKIEKDRRAVMRFFKGGWPLVWRAALAYGGASLGGTALTKLHEGNIQIIEVELACILLCLFSVFPVIKWMWDDIGKLDKVE